MPLISSREEEETEKYFIWSTAGCLLMRTRNLDMRVIESEIVSKLV